MIPRGWRAVPLALAVVACLAAPRAVRAEDDYVEAILASGEVAEAELLDVAIDLFSPSVDDTDREELLKQGSRPSVRKSEARFIPVHLRNTLQSTGQWGVVRVVPGGAPWAELSISGKIIESNGKRLKVEIETSDATGQRWFDRDYEFKANDLSYSPQKIDRLDPFQSLYNQIANDLVEERRERKREELVRVREVAQLRFAAEFASGSFGSYLDTRGGRYRAVRLPAKDDPMVGRLALIQERDNLFIDTLNEYYSDFYARMASPYYEWRANSYVELVPYDSLRKSSLAKKIFGGLAVLAGILLPAEDCEESEGVKRCRPSRTKETAKDLLVLGGIATIQAGAQDGAESQIHKGALQELIESLDADVSGLLVDIDGKVVQLTGSAEAQFTQWRELLGQIAHADAALPGDINVAPMSTAVVVTPSLPPSVDPDLFGTDASGEEPPAGGTAQPDEPADPDAAPPPAEGPLPSLAPATGQRTRPALRP